MRCTLATLALAALAAANPLPQAVSSAVAPGSSPPADCSGDYDGTFQIQVVKVSKRDLETRQNDPLLITLSGGVLTDSQGRTGYIASNSQFQFDAPPQAGAIYTSGFAVCSSTNYLTIGASDTWYQCLSGDFYNLYDKNVLNAGQCSPVHIVAVGGSSPPTTGTPTPVPTTVSGVATEIPDGQITASAVSSAYQPVCQLSDGQPQVTDCVTQISDGQVQAPTATAAPVTQISDGQIQAPTSTPAVCDVYVDGQPQCSSAAPVAPCSVYVDGQPQCPTSAAPYPTGTGGAVYPTGTGAVYPSSYAPIPATGAAATAGVGSQIFGLVAGVIAVALL